MRQFFDKTLETVSERIRSPMLSSTAIAWGIVNYKLFLVVLSDARFLEKIEYIEGKLYPTPELRIYYWAVYPLLAGLFYTLAYPAIDILFASLNELLNNLREKVLLIIRRKRPIDRDRTIEYFSQFDKQLEEKEKHLQSLLDLSESDRNRISAEIGIIRQRLKRQARLAACGSTYLDPEKLDLGLQDLSAFPSPSDFPQIAEAFQKIPRRKELLFVAKVLAIPNFDRMGRHLVSRGQLAGNDPPIPDPLLSDLIEILLALDLLTAVNDSPNVYEVTENRRRIERFRDLLNG